MGILDFLKPKKNETDATKKPQKHEAEPAAEPTGQFNEECAVCGKTGTDKKWAGQYWHKRCLRSSRRLAKGMI